MGRLEKQKRVDIAINLFNKGKFYKNYDLIIIGDGSQKDKLKSIAKSLNCDKYIKFIGHQNNPENWIKHASLLLSTSDYEGFNMVIAEALLLGTKVVASNCEFGPNEIMVGSLKQFLIETNNTQESIQIIRKALQHYPRTEQFTNIIKDRFSPSMICKEYIESVDKVL